jgi:hypothetical protein
MIALAWTGSSVVIAAVDNAGDLHYWWQQADKTSWNQETVATGLGLGSPAIAWTGSSVVIAAVDRKGDLYYWWQQADKTGWNQETVATGLALGGAFGQPAIAWAGVSVVIAAAASGAESNSLYFWWQQADTTRWHQETVVTNEAGFMGVYRAPAIAWTGSSVVIAAADQVGNLYYWWQWDPFGIGIEGFGPPLFPQPPWNKETVASVPGGFNQPAIAWTGSSVIIAAVDSTGTLHYWWQQANTTPWNGETVALNPLPPPPPWPVR